MDAVEQYFQGEYIVEKNKISEIETLLEDVIKTLALSKEGKWPYELKDNTDTDTDTDTDRKKNSSDEDDYSFSTNSMLLFVFAKFLNKIDENNSPIIPNTSWEFGKSLKDKVDKDFGKEVKEESKEEVFR